MDPTTCIGCDKKPEEIDEYVQCGKQNNMTPAQFVRTEEGTFNRRTGDFCCTSCYIKLGQPSSPFGWKAVRHVG